MKVFTHFPSVILVAALAAPAFAQQSGDQPRSDQQQDRARTARPAAEQQQDRDRQQQDRDRQQQGRDRQQETHDRQQETRGTQRQQRERRGRLAGDVVLTKRVDVRGTDRQHLVALIKTDRNNRFIVDFGPPGYLTEAMPSQGDRVQVFGRMKRIGDRNIIVADQLQKDGQVVRLDRRRRQDRGMVTRDQGPNQQRDPRQDQQRDPRQDQPRDRQQARRQPAATLGFALAYNPQTEKMHVVRVRRGGPADRAGIEPGDVILLVNNQAVTTASEMFQLLARMTPGRQVLLTVSRNGERRTTQAELEPRSEMAASESEQRNHVQRGQNDDRSR